MVASGFVIIAAIRQSWDRKPRFKWGIKTRLDAFRISPHPVSARLVVLATTVRPPSACGTVRPPVRDFKRGVVAHLDSTAFVFMDTIANKLITIGRAIKVPVA